MYFVNFNIKCSNILCCLHCCQDILPVPSFLPLMTSLLPLSPFLASLRSLRHPPESSGRRCFSPNHRCVCSFHQVRKSVQEHKMSHLFSKNAKEVIMLFLESVLELDKRQSYDNCINMRKCSRLNRWKAPQMVLNLKNSWVSTITMHFRPCLMCRGLLRGY